MTRTRTRTLAIRVSPPTEPPHGLWYVRGPFGCALSGDVDRPGDGFERAWRRYLGLARITAEKEGCEC